MDNGVYEVYEVYDLFIVSGNGIREAFWAIFSPLPGRPQLIPLNLVNCQVQDAIIIMALPILLCNYRKAYCG